MTPPTAEYYHQLTTVKQVAALYWERNLSDLTEPLQAIDIIKYTGGKMVGFLPQFNSFSPVFFKVYFNNAFEYELRGLRAADVMTKVPGVQTPIIVKIFSEHKAILTDKRVWDDTTTPINRFFVGSLGIDWRKIGQWLRAFHDSPVEQIPNEKFLRRKFNKINVQLDTLQSLFTPKQVITMHEIIDNARNYFATEPIEWVLSHGDFGLDNIKLANGKMEIIDFEDCQMAPKEFDLLNLLVRLEYVNHFPHLPSTFQQIQKKLLNGYGEVIKKTPAYDYFYLLIKLDVLETYYRRRNSIPRTSANYIIYSYFENIVKHQLFRWISTQKLA